MYDKKRNNETLGAKKSKKKKKTYDFIMTCKLKCVFSHVVISYGTVNPITDYSFINIK